MTTKKFSAIYGLFLSLSLLTTNCFADIGVFDLERWDNILLNIKTRATEQHVKQSVIDSVVKNAVFIPNVVKSDKKQSEFTLTLEQYLERVVSNDRIINGRKMQQKYPTLLSHVEQKFDIQPHVMLAFWGMESNYGTKKSTQQLTNSFLSLIYDGRRQEFFSNQLISLMKMASKNNLNINNIYGSWAGAMGHFQFIPTTLEQYGIDGNHDKKIDIINNVSDAMYSAGNYLHKLGWNSNEKIVRHVILPANFDLNLLNSGIKKSVKEWKSFGITNIDGTNLPDSEMIAGLIADIKNIPQTTDINTPVVITAYLTYPNFYRIKKWNNSNWYAIAIAELADKIK
ncbi:MAG: lytic murein transglycosylase [Alphaproteobacteria bacterium]|nr:lytic murein transglycosylase [Alphaproteobacteria bacterium]